MSTAQNPGPRGPDRFDDRTPRSAADRLFDQRVVFMWGPLDHTLAGHLAIQLMTLDATGDDPVHLHIDSPGGTLEGALSLIDVIDLLGVEVTATCVGQAAGPALGPLAVAHHRQATPHARFRLCEPVFEASGAARDLEAWATANRAQMGRFIERLATAVRTSPEALERDLATGRFLDAEQARRYGLIDEVCGPNARVYPMPRSGIGFRPSS
jgi:ATP-dependent Clp protease, protease subunit